MKQHLLALTLVGFATAAAAAAALATEPAPASGGAGADANQLITAGAVAPSESQTLTGATVIIDRDTAVVVGTDTLRGTDNGAAYTVVYRYTVPYVRREGRWLALAEHLAELPKAR